MPVFEGYVNPHVIGRCTTYGVADVPVYAEGDAISLLMEIRNEASLPSVAAHGVVMSPADAAALEWALERLGVPESER